jgi:hypothetical protein
MSNNKKSQESPRNYWREEEAKRKAKDERAKVFYEDRINDLLDLKHRGKGTPDYELNIVRVAAKHWMQLDRSRDALRFTGVYKQRYYNPGEEGIIDDSIYVKEIKKHRTILEGLFQAMGIPNQVAFECDETRVQ